MNSGNSTRNLRYLVPRMFLFFLVALLLGVLTCLVLLACRPTGLLLAIVITLLCCFAVLAYCWYRFVLLPYRQTEHLLALFCSDYTWDGVQSIHHPYSRYMGRTLDKIQQVFDSKELLQANKRQAQYLALQNQINPHFLYNTLEGIRSEALGAGLVSVAQMSETLAKFFRYTISNTQNLVTLEDELRNVENYFLIQQYRFGKRLHLTIELPEQDRDGVLRYHLPKITLQPIIENSIIHGLEEKIGDGTIRIKVETTQNRMLITISDDGVGMPADKLEELNRKLGERILSAESLVGGIALANVNNRLRLLFGEEYGLVFFSTPGLGTDVEITLPKIDETDGEPL